MNKTSHARQIHTASSICVLKQNISKLKRNGDHLSNPQGLLVSSKRRVFVFMFKVTRISKVTLIGNMSTVTYSSIMSNPVNQILLSESTISLSRGLGVEPTPNYGGVSGFYSCTVGIEILHSLQYPPDILPKHVSGSLR